MSMDCFFFNDTATTEIYTLSLPRRSSDLPKQRPAFAVREAGAAEGRSPEAARPAFAVREAGDRKSTRLNSSHMSESRMPSSA